MSSRIFKTYNEPLNLFRHGEPPILLEHFKKFPPYRILTDKQILNLEKKILEARERQKRSFIDIGEYYEVAEPPRNIQKDYEMIKKQQNVFLCNRCIKQFGENISLLPNCYSFMLYYKVKSLTTSKQ